MMSIFKKIISAAHNQKTYRVGLLQAKAYRLLKLHTNSTLHAIAPGITAVHWAFLGLVSDHKKTGIRFQDAASALGVEPPFVTALVRDMSKRDLVEIKKDAKDIRAKRIFLSKNGDAFVARAEDTLRDATKHYLKGIPLGDLLSYISVLERIVQNAEPDSSSLLTKKNLYE